MWRGTPSGVPAKAALEAKFRAEVDPEGKLSPAELQKRVRHAKSLYYARVSAERWGTWAMYKAVLR
jgi:hypothetical protein